MILSVVTQLEMKHPKIRVAEQLILTLKGLRVLRPDKSEEIDREIFLINLGIDVVRENPDHLEEFTKMIRTTRKWACQLLDEMENEIKPL